jgi:hypothetical protein
VTIRETIVEVTEQVGCTDAQTDVVVKHFRTIAPIKMDFDRELHVHRHENRIDIENQFRESIRSLTLAMLDLGDSPQVPAAMAEIAMARILNRN